MLRSRTPLLRAVKTPRQILGVAPHATFDQVKERFRELAREHHPDMATGDANKFREINAAYAILRQELKDGKPFTQTPSGGGDPSKPRRSGDSRQKHSYQKQQGQEQSGHQQQQYQDDADEYSEAKAEREQKANDRAAFRAYCQRSMSFLPEFALIGITIFSAIAMFYQLVVQVRYESREVSRKKESAWSSSGMPPELELCNFPVDEHKEKESEETQPKVQKKTQLLDKTNQRRFEDFQEFLQAFDPENGSERKISVHQLVSDAVDEPLIVERCKFVRAFNSDKQPNGFDTVVSQLAPQILTTKWENVDVPDAATLALQGVSRVAGTNPHRSKWTFVEYKRVDPVTRAAVGTTECVAAIRNERVGSIDQVQRVVITGHETMQMSKLRQRREDLSRGYLKTSDLASGGIPPIKQSFR